LEKNERQGDAGAVGEGEEGREVKKARWNTLWRAFVRRLPSLRRRRAEPVKRVPTFAEWLTGVQRIDPAKLTTTDRAEWERLYRRMAARAAGPPDPQDLQYEYFRTALEYYIAARFSALSFFMPMSGVMFHHAIELYLKGLLCPVLNEKKRTNLGHNLRRAWKKYKSLTMDASLSRFDDRVAELDRHWGVRYPDEIIRHGIRAGIGFEKSPSAVASGGGSPPRYVLMVEELDELTAVLWKKAGLNIKAFMPSSPEARESLEQWNKWIFW
jgi:hypothetical protein